MPNHATPIEIGTQAPEVDANAFGSQRHNGKFVASTLPKKFVCMGRDDLAYSIAPHIPPG